MVVCRRQPVRYRVGGRAVTDMGEWSAARTASAIASGEISAVEATQAPDFHAWLPTAENVAERYKIEFALLTKQRTAATQTADGFDT